MTLFETIIVSFLTTFSTASIGFLFYYLRVKMKEKSSSKAELEHNKRESFQKLLNEHSELVLGIAHQKPFNDWQKDFSEMSKSILLWGSDDVLSEYGKYAEMHYSDESENEIKERELHFAKAILAFRKELGYKNKRDKITPAQIVFIFRCGYKNGTI